MSFYISEKENFECYNKYKTINVSKYHRAYSTKLLKDKYFLKYAQRRIALILNQNIKKNATILDLGAGTGLNGFILKKLRPDITIISSDLSCAFLQINPSENKIQNDSKHIPLKNGSVDYALCSQVFHHLPCLKETMAELSRVVKEGIFINEVNSNNPICLIWHLLQKDERRLLKNNYFALIKEVKKHFRITKFQFTEFVPYFKTTINKLTFPLFYYHLEHLTKVPIIKNFSGNYFAYCQKLY